MVWNWASGMLVVVWSYWNQTKKFWLWLVVPGITLWWPEYQKTSAGSLFLPLHAWAYSWSCCCPRREIGGSKVSGFSFPSLIWSSHYMVCCCGVVVTYGCYWILSRWLVELSIVERIGRKKIGYWFRVRVSRREDEGASSVDIGDQWWQGLWWWWQWRWVRLLLGWCS